jgi:hypothetical protein
MTLARRPRDYRIQIATSVADVRFIRGKLPAVCAVELRSHVGLFDRRFMLRKIRSINRRGIWVKIDGDSDIHGPTMSARGFDRPKRQAAATAEKICNPNDVTAEVDGRLRTLAETDP